jgi:glycine dehydrogenase subunit 1
MATLGPQGLRQVANRGYQNAHYLANLIDAVPGYRVALDAPFFHEFVVATPVPASEVLGRLLEHGILGGLDLGSVEPALDHYLLVCATETNTRAGIERMVAALPR